MGPEVNNLAFLLKAKKLCLEGTKMFLRCFPKSFIEVCRLGALLPACPRWLSGFSWSRTPRHAAHDLQLGHGARGQQLRLCVTLSLEAMGRFKDAEPLTRHALEGFRSSQGRDACLVS